MRQFIHSIQTDRTEYWMESRISPRDIIILLNILHEISVSSSYFPLLPFTYHTIQEVLSKKVSQKQANVSENVLIKNFQQNIQKYLTIFNCEMYWLFLSSNSCLKMTCFCSFQRAWIDSIVFLSKAHQRAQILAGFLFFFKREKKGKHQQNKAKNNYSFLKGCGLLHF